MSQYLVDQIYGTENIEVLTDTEVVEANGKEKLEALTIMNRETGTTQTLPAAAVFIFIGAVPHSELVADVVARNSAGFIVIGSDLTNNGSRPKHWKYKRDPFPLETSVPGIFAAGDVCQGVVRRVASAVGQGAIAISQVHRYLETV